jgi:hypothetical protein
MHMLLVVDICIDWREKWARKGERDREKKVNGSCVYIYIFRCMWNMKKYVVYSYIYVCVSESRGVFESYRRRRRRLLLMNASRSISYTDEAYAKIKRKNNKSLFIFLHIYTYTYIDTIWTKRTHDEILDKRKEIVVAFGERWCACRLLPTEFI